MNINLKRGPLLISLPKGNNVKEVKSSIPLSCMQLSAWLRVHGFEAKYLDFSTSYVNDSSSIPKIAQDVLLEMKRDEPLFIGLNCFTTIQFPLLYGVVKEIKQAYPNCKICIGGMHPSLFAKDILTHCPEIDFIAIGEGEEQILALTRKLSGLPVDLTQLQAFAYRPPGGEVQINPRRNYLSNFEVPPEQLWRDISLSSYQVNTSRWHNPKQLDFQVAAPIMTTRSCPFQCSFCSVAGFMGRILRKRKPEAVLDEMEYLYDRHNVRYFEFIDDNINIDKKHALTIFQGIGKRGMNIHFSLTNGIHLASTDERLIDVMAENGLAMIKFPVEHGNDYIRNQVIGKRLSRETIVRLSEYIRGYNVFTFGLFIMGFPEDTCATLDDTLNLMDEMALDIYAVANLIPFPGTKIYIQCQKDGLLLKSVTPEELYKGELFLDSSEQKFYLKPYQMSLEQLLMYRKKFNQKYLYSAKAKALN